ncbi:hypothetical protein BJV74DRAFT_796929 [Russula compacta]|nr:hypothetical protein BJV74DRAFT_796929 [Russula compacta]
MTTADSGEQLEFSLLSAKGQARSGVEAAWLWDCARRWKVMVMESVKPDLNASHHARTHWIKWKEDLTGLVESIREQGWVHGDLRDVNFLVPSEEPERTMLIDFEWGGESREVSYLTWLFDKELTRWTLIITKKHDVRVFKAALENLKP